MRELTLLGLNVDTGQLQLTDDQDNTYVLAITEDLRSAVRRSALAVAGTDSQAAPAGGSEADQGSDSAEAQPLRPREIQDLVRAGMTPAEIMAEYGEEDEERIDKFASAVISERRYIVQRTLDIKQSRERGAPSFGEVVINRLATRDVSEEDVSWDAVRRADEPWEVSVTFRVDDCEKRAAWAVDFHANSIRPIDDEARWLTEVKTSSRTSPDGLLSPSLRSRDRHSVTDYPAAGLRPDPSDSLVPRRPAPAGRPRNESAGTDTLLDHLSATRGSRSTHIPGMDEEESTPSAPSSAVSGPRVPTSHSPLSAPSSASASSAPAPSAASASAASANPGPRGEHSADSASSPARPGARIFSLPERRRRNKEREDSTPVSKFPAPGSTSSPADASAGSAASSQSGGSAASAASPAEDGALLSRPESGEVKVEKPAKKKSRQSIPSWDEIVFGTKKDD